MELKIATRNFRSKLASDGLGLMFKESLTNGMLVAVKKLEGLRQYERQFRAKISSVGNIQYANLIRFRGFCAEGSRGLLVYEYMPNGPLNYLPFTCNSKSKWNVLDWLIQLYIASSTVRGLVYLHKESIGDVKPESILLDDNFSPVLEDFGLAKVVGTDFHLY
ncbi:G-type lectin S-receptor-like serine/threonine-protein kinase At2g19130 [Cryptomeria japonica]|uniref:G-type lectin S-receptor-like serine/threonine-protein kinase At2g19130 n=1 Tax=Cryptomeria japonica TaxID=3369 RepID=UPI0025AC9528|nr:G-type lectin S-receptor-like serine/threonine-protein kinase At2g19130 [Cryptomeria japonica]